jgi:hypothetical protein
MARQSVYELVFRHTTRIERLLAERGGEGTGLMGKAERVRYRLSGSVWRDLEWISAERNRVAHQENPYLEDRHEFERCAKRVIYAIEAIPLDHDRNVMGFLRRAFSNSGRRRRSRPPASLQIVGVVIVGIVMLTMMSHHRDAREKVEVEIERRRREFDRGFSERTSVRSYVPGLGTASTTASSAQRRSIAKQTTKSSRPKSQAANASPSGAANTRASLELPDEDSNPSGEVAEVDAGAASPAGTIKMTVEELDSF